MTEGQKEGEETIIEADSAAPPPKQQQQQQRHDGEEEHEQEQEEFHTSDEIHLNITSESPDCDPDENDDDYGDPSGSFHPLLPPDEPENARNRELISTSVPRTPLEVALKAELDRVSMANALLTGEYVKLRRFLAKRKQTYKRKRKDEGAPRKKLSGYNLFVRERFAKLARENEDALRSADDLADLKRIPPARNIASSGKAWSVLSAEEKARYNAM